MQVVPYSNRRATRYSPYFNRGARYARLASQLYDYTRPYHKTIRKVASEVLSRKRKKASTRQSTSNARTVRRRTGRRTVRGVPQTFVGGPMMRVWTPRKYKKVNNAASKGGELDIEIGGTIDQGGNSDYPACIGHSTFAFKYILDVTCRAIMRKLFHMTGYMINSQKQHLQRGGVTETVSPGKISYAYRYRTVDPMTRVDIAIQPDADFDLVVAQLNGSFAGLLTNFTDNAPHLWIQYVELTLDDTHLRVSRLDMESAIFHFNVRSQLRLQNRTPGTSGNAVDDDLVTSIAVNPLIGKAYSVRGVNGFRPKHVDEYTTINGQSFCPNTLGLILCNITNIGGDERDKYLHPPSPHIFADKCKAGGVKMDPGTIRTLKDSNRMTIRFPKLLEKLVPLYRGQAQALLPQAMCGSAQMVIVEKLMDTEAAEPEISLGYELNAHYSCYITMAKPFCESKKIRES